MVILIKGVIIICISCISTCSILPEHCTGSRKFKVFCFQQITKKIPIYMKCLKCLGFIILLLQQRKECLRFPPSGLEKVKTIGYVYSL